MKYRKGKCSVASAIAVIVVLYLFLEGIGITCPIKFLTGISCAGCGMSRAWMAALKLDFSTAFYYHPLFLTPPLVLIVFLLKNRIKPQFYKGFMFTIIVLYVMVYLYRLIWGDHEIVAFRPTEGIVVRLIEKIIS